MIGGCFAPLFVSVAIKLAFEVTTRNVYLASGFELSFFFFNACILRYYLSKPLTSLSCPLNAVFPGLKMWDTFACATAIF
jgi:hypothetical protein